MAGDAVVLVAEAWSRRYGVNPKLDLIRRDLLIV